MSAARPGPRDLDGFKQINDGFGHPTGDEVLAAYAQRMAGAVRAAVDLVGRVGGEEFIIALRGVGPADAALGHTAAARSTPARQAWSELERALARYPGDRAHKAGHFVDVICT